MNVMVECRDVGRVYPGGVTALEGVDLVISDGEYVALMGPSGSGKTTLVNLLGLLDSPTSGELLFQGEDTTGWSDKLRSERRASAIGFVFQSFHLLDDRTVAENVELGLIHQRVPHKQRLPAVQAAIEQVGLSDRAGAMARTLSGGEQQRTAVARALVRKPSVLLCDEPVGNLDGENADNILRIVGDLNKGGMTVIMVTHDPATAARADRIVRIRRGRMESSDAGR